MIPNIVKEPVKTRRVLDSPCFSVNLTAKDSHSFELVGILSGEMKGLLLRLKIQQTLFILQFAKVCAFGSALVLMGLTFGNHTAILMSRHISMCIHRIYHRMNEMALIDCTRHNVGVHVAC